MTRGLTALALLVCGLFVYRPALNRFFADDQLWYFAELKGDRSLSAGLALLDYDVARTYMKGDQLLYRPLTMLVLAAENAAFGRDYRRDNAVNLVLHLAVAYLLFELLFFLAPSPFAGAFALLFCVLSAGFELVVWNHLAGYLLGFALLLLAMLSALKSRAGPRAWLAVYAASILGAMLCHEIAVAAGVLLGARLVSSRRRAFYAAAAAPLVAFVILYAFHLARCERLFFTAAPAGAAPRSILIDVVRTVLVWTGRALDPWYAAVGVKPCVRLRYAPDAVPSVLTALFAAAGGAAAFLLRSRSRRVPPSAALAALLMLDYAVMVNLGRTYADAVAYYPYLFALMGLVLTYTLLDVSTARPAARLGAAAILAGFVAVNAWSTRRAALLVERAHAGFDAYAADMTAKADAFIAARPEPDLTFVVRVAPAELNPSFPYWTGFPEGPPEGLVAVTDLLYMRYRSARPKYVLNLDYRRESNK